MQPASIPVKVTTSAFVLIFLTAIVWMLRGYQWPMLSSVEVMLLEAMLHPDWYVGDFVIQESQHFTPRFFFNGLVLLPARAGLSLASAYAVCHVTMLAVFLAGLRSLSSALNLRPAAAAALIVWLLTVAAGTLGAVFFYSEAPVPAVWAGALVTCGAAAAARGRWLGAFGWFGAASLLQFLVGFYAGVLALGYLASSRTRPRMLDVSPWLLALAAVYLPMKLAGTSGGGELGNDAFVQIYAHLRHPHHLVPSSWGWAHWTQAAAFYSGTWWLLQRTSKEHGMAGTGLLSTTLALVAGALVVNFLFVEWIPVAFVAKLQPARITPLAQGICLVALARLVSARIEGRDYFSAGLLTLVPLSPFPGFMLLLFAVLLPVGTAGATSRHWIVAASLFLAFSPFDPTIASRSVRYCLWLGIFLAWLGSLTFARRPIIAAVGALLAASATVFCAANSSSAGWPSFISNRFSIDSPPPNALARLGNQFARTAPAISTVLIPPGSESWVFKLYAHRAVVVDDKDFPFTDRGMLEWKTRMDAVLGVPLRRDTDTAAAWRQRTPEELASVASRFGARHVLTRDEWHPQMPGVREASDGGWTLWKLQ